jgi:hypothetical protein
LLTRTGAGTAVIDSRLTPVRAHLGFVDPDKAEKSAAAP